MKRVPWSEKEDTIIRKHYPEEGLKTHLRVPGKTLHQVRMRAKRLGVRAKPKWTVQQILTLRRMFGSCSLYELSQLTGHSQQACSSKLLKMGFRSDDAYQGTTTVQAAADEFHLSYSVVKRIVNCHHFVGIERQIAPRRGPWLSRIKRYDKSELHDALHRWVHGKSLNEHAKRLGISSNTLARWLREDGVQINIRKLYFRIYDEEADDAFWKRQSGINMDEIKRRLGIGYRRAEKKLTELGIHKMSSKRWRISESEFARLSETIAAENKKPSSV